MEEILQYTLFFLTSLLLTLKIIPIFIKKMIKAGLTGIDVNKIEKPNVPEMGGLGVVIAFSLSLSFSVGIMKLYDSFDSFPSLVLISVLCMAALIGIMDDISLLARKEKAWLIAFSSLPLVISQIGSDDIDLIFIKVSFTDYYTNLFFWLIVVPFGVTCCANAINMSAGYNGLESGQMAIMSFFIFIISLVNEVGTHFALISCSMLGSQLALFYYNKFPAKTFVGDVGTLSFGSLFASFVIMTNQIVFGIICILPSFYELFATIKYKFKGIERRHSCMNPVIFDDRKISVPAGSEDYTLAFKLLSFRSMTEVKLVNSMLLLYVVSGFISLLIALVF